MIKKWMILIGLLFLIAGCTPTTGDVNPEPEVDQMEAEEVLMNTAVPTPTPPENSPEEVPTTPPGPTAEPLTPEPAATDSENVQQSDPTVVDLSKVTPEPGGGDSGPVVQPAPGVPGATAKLVQDVMNDLSSRLGIDVGEVELVAIAEASWRDSSLGCPQPGMSYLQVITEGYSITLKANDQEHAYHTRDTSRFVYCLHNPKVGEPITQPVPPDQ